MRKRGLRLKVAADGLATLLFVMGQAACDEVGLALLRETLGAKVVSDVLCSLVNRLHRFFCSYPGRWPLGWA